MLPAYGLWARHVDGLVLDDVSFTLDDGTTDARDEIVLDDVTDVVRPQAMGTVPQNMGTLPRETVGTVPGKCGDSPQI
jgi:hypothetical protein